MKKIMIFTIAVIMTVTAITAVAVTPPAEKESILSCIGLVHPSSEEVTANLQTDNDLLDPPVVTLPEDNTMVFYAGDRQGDLEESDLASSVKLPDEKVIFFNPPYQEIYWPPQVETIEMLGTIVMPYPEPITVPIPKPIVVPLPPIIWSETGEVKYVDIEDGFYGIVSDNGKCYDPVNLPSEFQKDGLQVNFKMKVLQDQVNFHMWGITVEILEIESIP